MIGLILRAINGPVLVLITAICIALQTSLFQPWPLTYFQPDCVLLVVLWCALRRGFTEGGIITLVVADLAEIHSAASSGTMLVAYMAVYLGVRASSRLFVIPDLHSFVIVTLFASVGWKLACLTVLYALGVGPAQWEHTLYLMFPSAVVEGCLGFWAFRWLEKFDNATHKRLHTEQASLAAPDELGYTGYEDEFRTPGGLEI